MSDPTFVPQHAIDGEEGGQVLASANMPLHWIQIDFGKEIRVIKTRAKPQICLTLKYLHADEKLGIS